METLIVSGGYLDSEFACAYMRQYPCELVIAVDSGMEFFYEHGLIPDYIVGDFDSVKTEVLQYFQNMEQKKPVILQFQPEKDETDTELAMRTAIEKGTKRIHLLGATGSRVDHMIGNIHLLGAAMKQRVECFMVDKHNRIRMIERGMVLKQQEQYGNYVSLFPFTPQVRGLTLTGFKYPLNCYTLECYHSLGVSNEIVEEKAEISFDQGVLLVVESKD